jgi:hypothetical protein
MQRCTLTDYSAILRSLNSRARRAMLMLMSVHACGLPEAGCRGPRNERMNPAAELIRCRAAVQVQGADFQLPVPRGVLIALINAALCSIRHRRSDGRWAAQCANK